MMEVNVKVLGETNEFLNRKKDELLEEKGDAE